jgi:hypothetical protein
VADEHPKTEDGESHLAVQLDMSTKGGHERALNAFRLTLFGILVSIGLTAGFGSAAFVEGVGPRVVVGVGVGAVVLTALLLRLCHGPIAALMHWIVSGA